MRELTPEEWEACFKKILPPMNTITEVFSRYLGPGVELAIRFDTDGTFCIMPPYPEPMLCRDENEEFPRFVDKSNKRHKMVRENGRIKWKITKN